MKQNFVAIKPIAKDASPAQRMLAFFEHCQEQVAANPHLMLPLGVKKRWWQLLRTEHPFTTKYKLEIPNG